MGRGRQIVEAIVRDRHGRPLVSGWRVRILAAPTQDGEIRRVIQGYQGDRYDVVTVIVDGGKAGKAERMVRADDVEVLDRVQE